MQSYRHTQTGRYIHIDGQDGRFHNQNGDTSRNGILRTLRAGEGG
jgi:hypothetical protein